MKRIVFVFLLLAGFTTLKAQLYERSIGVRLGYTSGITGKVIKNNRAAIEGILGFRQGGMQVYALVESYKPLIVTPKAKWMMYFGGGGHLGYINGFDKVRHWSNSYGYYWEEIWISGMVIGIDGVIGTDYTFPKVPISLSLEFKPYFEVQNFQRVDVNFWDVAFGIKYTF